MTHITNKNLDHCAVTWEISNKCNYSCWYCPEYLHSGTSGWPNFSTSVDFFNDLSTKHSKIHLDLIGGEPTIWPKFNEFVDSISDNIGIELTTNGSRSLKWWSRLSKKVKTVTISVHFNSADLDHIVSVCELLKGKVNLTVMFLFDPKFTSEIEYLNTILTEKDITHYAHYILPNFGEELINYTEEEIKFSNTVSHQAEENNQSFKPGGFFIDGEKKNIQKDIIVSQKSNFNGWACRAGNKRLHIGFDGIVYAGSCRSYNLGNINQANDIKLVEDYVICNRSSCTCVDDVRVEKWTLDE